VLRELSGGKAMEEFRVVIPEERFRILEFNQESLPGIAVVNESLLTFEPKQVFAWHLSIMIQFEDLILNGMPSEEEREIIDAWGDLVDDTVKGDETDKPNALFLSRITWNGSRELIYRVYEPEPVAQYLVNVIDTKSYPRNFDYRMEHDPEWELAKWHLNSLHPHAPQDDNV
jgi:hypothetical protein